MGNFWKCIGVLGLGWALAIGCSEEAAPTDPCAEYQQAVAKKCNYCTKMGGVSAEVKVCTTACKRSLSLTAPDGCPKQ